MRPHPNHRPAARHRASDRCPLWRLTLYRCPVTFSRMSSSNFWVKVFWVTSGVASIVGVLPAMLSLLLIKAVITFLVALLTCDACQVLRSRESQYDDLRPLARRWVIPFAALAVLSLASAAMWAMECGSVVGTRIALVRTHRAKAERGPGDAVAGRGTKSDLVDVSQARRL